MIAEALKWLHEHTRTINVHVIKKDGREFFVHPINGSLTEFAPAERECSVQAATLDGFIRLTEHVFDVSTEEDGGGLITVAGPSGWLIVFSSGYRRGHGRDARVACIFNGPTVERIGGTTSALVTRLQTDFMPGEERDRLLKVLANVYQSQETRIADDGVGQEIAARNVTGPGVGWAKVVNPFLLQPVCTYAEIEQPRISYVLRFRKEEDKDDPIKASITPHAHPHWQTETIGRIAAYLRERLPSIPIGG